MKRLITELLNEAGQASEDAFERALMRSRVVEAFSDTLLDGLDKLEMYYTEREINFPREHVKHFLLTCIQRYEDKAQRIMFNEFDSILAEFCKRVDKLTDGMSKEFTELELSDDPER